MPSSNPGPANAARASIDRGEPRINPVHDVGSYHPTDSVRVPVVPAVHVVDTTTERVRQPRDLLSILIGALGIIGILFLAVFAHGTTEGVQTDVQGFARLLGRILLFPVAILEGLVTLIVPLLVILELSLRRHFRQLVESLAASGLGLVLSILMFVALEKFATASLLTALSVQTGGETHLSIPTYVAGIAGLLTAAGPRTRRRSVNWSWNLMWITLGVLLITAQVSLPGVAIALLLGRIGGLIVRYISGVRSERAYGPDLIDGVRRAGFEPLSLVRVRDVSDAPKSSDIITVVPSTLSVIEHATTRADDHATDRPDTDPDVTSEPLTESSDFDPSAVALMRSADNRVYALTTTDGPRLDVVVLDGDRQVLGLISRVWRSLRLRGLEGRTAISLRAVAERAALLTYAALSAGVRTPQLLGMAEAEDSMLFVQSHAQGAVSLRDVDPANLSDEVLRECWNQLQLAHAAGLAHRSLTSDVVLVNTSAPTPEVWLTGWESGDVASADFARRMDLAQMLALLALRVGAERAMASASDVISVSDMEKIGPILQSIVLPTSTREELRSNKGVLADLRAALVARLPEANVEPERLVRFGTRTILTVTLGIVAAVVVITTINFREIAAAVSSAQPWWALVCFLLGALTWFGAAVAFLAFSPVKIPLWRTTLTQAAASYVALAAPAGIGPAVLNLRLLTRRGVAMSLAGATVALVQVSQILVTVLLLVSLTLITGDGGLLRTLPSGVILWALGVLAVVISGVLLVPQLRRWLAKKTQPMLHQTWPRLSEILSQPGRLALGLAGNAGMTMGFVLAFNAALKAFGQDVPLISVAVIYLVGNAVGAAAPTPGGIGAIEGVLTATLTATAGVPAGIALSVVILFRVMTYWVRIPIGWFAMRELQRKGDL